MKAILVGAAALLFIAAAVGHAAPSAPEKPGHIIGKLLTPDGKPATDATVFLFVWDQKTNKTVFTKTRKPGSDGSYDIAIPPALQPSIDSGWSGIILYAKSPEGISIGGRYYTSTALAPFTRVRVRLVDEEGKPAAHVRFSPESFQIDRNHGHWEEGLGNGWNAVTDAQGYATLDKLPQGNKMSIQVHDERFAPLDWRATITLGATAQTDDQTITLTHGGTVTGVVHFGDTGKPAAGAFVQAFEIGSGTGRGYAKADAQGRYSLTRLAPGAYNVETSTEMTGPPEGGKQGVHWENWTAVAHPYVIVTGGKSVSDVDFRLIHGALITGHVTDKVKGTPIAGAFVTITGPAHPSNENGGVDIVTGADGAYKVRVPAGKQYISVYIQATGDTSNPQSVEIAEGETKTADFQAVAPKPPVVAAVMGTVVGPDGAPIAGAEVYLHANNLTPPKKITDAQGKFTFGPVDLGDSSELFARAGTLATPAATSAPEDGSPVTLKLAPDTLCAFQGKVVDQDGKPMAHISVTLTRWSKNNRGWNVTSTTTDDAGHYAFPPDFSDAKYGAEVRLDGYETKYTGMIAAEPAKTVDLPLIKTYKLDSFVGGVVLDRKGNPAAGATIQIIAVSGARAVTDKAGRFHITGTPRRRMSVVIEAEGDRQASDQIAGGRDDNEITVKSQAEREEEDKRYVALHDADANHHGDGGSAYALLNAARIKAAREGKSIFLVFHATWCGPCFLLHRYLEDPKIKQVLEKHFVVQDLDIWEKGNLTKWENPGGVDIYKQYGGPGTIPFYAVLDPKGKKLGDAMHDGQNIGMPKQTDDIECFLDILRRAQPSLTSDEIMLLKAELKQHASL
jgi:protocatechuate 3,4-dioxygenase beta subunit